MALDQILSQFSTAARVLGCDWLVREQSWIVPFIEERRPWYNQLEADVSALICSGLPEQRLIQCYRDPLRTRNEIQKAMYEIHAAALLAACSQRIDIHVPRGDGTNRNYDISAEIEGARIAAECKTRKDEFPFNMPAEETEHGGPLYGGSRGMLDPHDAAVLGFTTTPTSDPRHKATPESTVIKQTLSEGLSQLPQHGFNLIVFGQIEGDVFHLEEALFGTEYAEMRRNLQTGEITTHWLRAPNGAFNAQERDFDSISAVLWVRLWRDGDALNKTYRGYLNPRARSPLPANMVERLRAITVERGTPSNEVDTK